MQEIGHRLGLTRQAVQQAEARARLRLPTLRHWLAADGDAAAADDDTPRRLLTRPAPPVRRGGR